MNFTQLQERLRTELLRRIDRGTLSVSLLARQSGLGQAHVSNFLRARRGVSVATLDKMLAAQRLEIPDLLPAPRETRGPLLAGQFAEPGYIPLVSHSVALFDVHLRPSAIQSMLPFPTGSIQGLRSRCTVARRQWERFVGVRMSAEDARPMQPMLAEDALVVIDRHYNSFRPYRELDAAPNLYAIRVAEKLLIRYADFQAGRVVLRPVALNFPLQAIEPAGSETANDLIAGRVVVVQREH
jgi:transcriptional regulator with XRE-family HTH domain